MEILKIKYKGWKGKIIFILLFGSFLLISSCRKKDSTVKLPEVPSKLVIVSFISPQDSLIKVSVTLSQPLYNNAASNQYNSVTDAEVIISSSIGSASLVYNAVLKSYVVDSTLLKIREGISYVVSVKTPDGKRANATTSIPSVNKTISYSFNADSTKLRCAWLDQAGSIDFYRLFLQNSSYFLFEGHNNQSGDFSDTIKVNYATTEWALDKDQDGEVLKKAMDFSPLHIEGQSYYLFLLHVSKEYYDYGIKLLVAQNTGNPFAEPVPMYSNVNGGFGIFAGCNSFKVKVF